MSEVRKRSQGHTRQRIIEAARLELVAGRGEFDVADVATRAGVSDGLTYYHFKNKLGLLSALVEDFYDRLNQSVLDLSIPGATWREREKRRTRAYVRYMYEDPIGFYVVNNLTRLPALHELRHQAHADTLAVGARNIALGQRDGDLPESTDPDLLVAMILAGVGAGVSRAMETSPDRPWEEVFEEVWAFVERAAGTVEPVGPALSNSHNNPRH